MDVGYLFVAAKAEPISASRAVHSSTQRKLDFGEAQSIPILSDANAMSPLLTL